MNKVNRNQEEINNDDLAFMNEVEICNNEDKIYSHIHSKCFYKV